MTVTVPKRVPVERLFARLGQQRAERLLAQLYAEDESASARIQVSPEAAREALALVAQPLVRSRSWAKVIPLLRRWLAERPRHQSAFEEWLRGVADEASEATPPKRRRAASPDVLDARKASLEKARAVRAAKRAAKG